jgi:hypothetical protein
MASIQIERLPRQAKIFKASAATQKAAVKWFRLLRSGFKIDDGGFCNPGLKEFNIARQYTPGGHQRLEEYLGALMYVQRLGVDYRGKPVGKILRKSFWNTINWVVHEVSTRRYEHSQHTAQYEARWLKEDGFGIPEEKKAKHQPAGNDRIRFKVKSANSNSTMIVWFA